VIIIGPASTGRIRSPGS